MFRQIDGGPAAAGRACANPVREHRSTACVELLTTAALAASTAIAITAVSIGMARADVIGAVAAGDGTPFAVALCIGLMLGVMGGLTAVAVRVPRRD